MTSFPYDSFSQPGVFRIQYVEMTPESTQGRLNQCVTFFSLAFLEALMRFKVQNAYGAKSTTAEISPKIFPGPVQP